MESWHSGERSPGIVKNGVLAPRHDTVNLAQQRCDVLSDPPNLLEDACQVELPSDDSDGSGDGEALRHNLGASHGLQGNKKVGLAYPWDLFEYIIRIFRDMRKAQ